MPSNMGLQVHHISKTTDVGLEDLKAGLLYDGHPIYFASSGLQHDQKSCISIEIAVFAIIWTVEKFHLYLYGKKFQLKIDQSH